MLNLCSIHGDVLVKKYLPRPLTGPLLYTFRLFSKIDSH